MDSVVNTIQEVIETVCDKYCKFPDEYSQKYQDEDQAIDNLLKEKCEGCILNKLF